MGLGQDDYLPHNGTKKSSFQDLRLADRVRGHLVSPTRSAFSWLWYQGQALGRHF